MRNLILTLTVSGVAIAQGVPGGTINGKAIPERVFRSARVCDDLRSAICDQAQDEAVRDMGINVTSEDIAAIRQRVHRPEPVAESKRIIEHTTLMISALTAVDRGQDQHQVYLQMLLPKGVPEAEWTSYQQQWKDPTKRANIERRLTLTPDVIAKGLAAVDYRPMAIKHKLDAAVDQILAKDATFKMALDHWNASALVHPDGSVQHGGPLEEQQYMDRQRASWWKGRVRMMEVTLNDPTLAAKCNLAEIGVTAK
jgi:hypothetical protein